MAKFSRRTMVRIFLRATIFEVLVSRVLGQAASSLRSSEALRQTAPSFRSPEVNLQDSTPFSPQVIIDPFSDIKCDDLVCKVGENKDACEDYPLRLCTPYLACPESICLHKSLFPILRPDILLMAALSFVAMLAGAAGIGGGGINVPSLVTIGHFSMKEAVPISHLAVLGNSLAQLIVNMPQSDPNSFRPLIHYELALLLLPSQLGGSSLGLIFGRLFPQSALVLLATAVLLFAAAKSFTKGCHLLHEQHQQAQQEVKPTPIETAGEGSLHLPLSKRTLTSQKLGPGTSPCSAGSGQGSLLAPHLWNTVEYSPMAAAAVAGTHGKPHMQRSWSGGLVIASSTVRLPSSTPLLAPLDSDFSEESWAPMPWKVLVLIALFNLAFCLDFLVMDQDVSGVRTCSFTYWLVLVGLYPFVFGCIWIGVQTMKESAEIDRVCRDLSGKTGRSILLLPLAAGLVGLVSGLVGLGGGELIVPLLLAFGLHPRAASATSGLLVFFSTFSNLVHYLVVGVVEPFWGYCITFAALSFISGLVGLRLKDTQYMRTRSYLLVFLVVLLLLVAAALLAYRAYNQPISWEFRSICAPQ